MCKSKGYFMVFFKKMIFLSICAILIFGLSACKKDNGQNVNDTASKVSNPNTDFSIGNTTVKEIMNKFSEISLNDGLVLSLTTDGTSDEYHSFLYEIKDSEGVSLATVNASSDTENKLAMFSIFWDYKKADSKTNASLIAASKTLIIAAWPDYSEESMAVVEKTIRFDTSYFNALRNKNINYTANAAIGGYISAGMLSGRVSVSICYPDLVENV